MPRIFAALIALVAWVALAVQYRATLGLADSVPQALWVLLRYFTVMTNLLVAVVMTGIALDRPRFGAPILLGFVTLSILLVGIVYMTLLRGMLELSGGALLADALLHKCVPLLVPSFWLAFAPKGQLGWRDPWWWSLYPCAYFAYALMRGSAEGAYAYPFIDLGTLGPARVAINAAAIAAAFLAAGFGFVALDRALARRAPRG
ncbi:MAG: Pr6Pr family membrane protein [Pseudomonadota bacterium]|nr:Pr6Pr family membrane protein [Pseudomonadota bacterium]